MPAAASVFGQLVGNASPAEAFTRGTQLRATLDHAAAQQQTQAFEMLMQNVRRNDENRQFEAKLALQQQDRQDALILAEQKLRETARVNDARITADIARAGYYDRRGTGAASEGEYDPNVAAAISGELPIAEPSGPDGSTPTVSATGDPGLLPPMPGQPGMGRTQASVDAIKERSDLIGNSTVAHKRTYNRTPQESLQAGDATDQEKQDAQSIARIQSGEGQAPNAQPTAQNPTVSESDQILHLMGQAKSYMAQTPKYRSTYAQPFARNQENLAKLLEKTNPVNLIVERAGQVDEKSLSVEIAKDPIYQRHVAAAQGRGPNSALYATMAEARVGEMVAKKKAESLADGFGHLESILGMSNVPQATKEKALEAKQKLLNNPLGPQAYNAYQQRQQELVQRTKEEAIASGMEPGSVTVGTNAAGKPFVSQTYKTPKGDEVKTMTESQLMTAERSLSATYSRLSTDATLQAANSPTASPQTKAMAQPIIDELQKITGELSYIRSELGRRRSGKAAPALPIPSDSGKITPKSFY